MKTVLISAFILIFFIVSCDGLKPNEDVTVDTVDNVFFQQSENKNLSIPKRLVAIDSFLVEARNSADTLAILLGLKKKTYLLGVSRKYGLSIPYCKELLNIAIARESNEYTRLGYDKISRYYSSLSDYDSSVYYAKELVEFSKGINDSIGIAKGYFKLGLYKKEQHKLTESFKYFNDAFLIRRKKKDSVNAVTTLLEMAQIQKKLGNYRASQATATDGLSFVNKASKVGDVVGLNLNIATTNRELNNYEEALTFNKKALKIETRTKSILTLKNTEANIYADQGNYKKAVLILDSILNSPTIKKSKEARARVSSNLGRIKWLENRDNDKSEELLLEALRLREEIGDVSGLIASYTHLTEYYADSNKELALAYAEKNYENAKTLNNSVEIIKSITWIFELKDALGKSISNQMGLERSRAYKYIREANNETERIYADTKFENDALKNKNFELEIEAEKKQKQNTIALAIVIVLIISSVFLYVTLKSKHKREKVREIVKETYETERRLSKKVHDELANDMSGVMNLIDNDAAIPNDVKEPLVNKLEDLYERTRDISAEIAGFDSNDFARSLKFLITQYNSHGVNVITNVTSGINWDTISDHKKINIYRSLQELLVNAKKYSKASEITVIFKSEGRKHFINYTDNGIGFEFDTINKRGLQNVETRIKNIQGIITFNTSKGNGFKAHLYFFS
ncbi:hypothetical protein [uncultured Dokdonia sp.]|uniref:tetratricopeptide repeat-containing sensor histidine kinase n=1 Tax=uncultured Dokdonia sp. TaxID=575653 RepID=UPI00260AB36E|nr:hypothetical protein [uncultured Dokdonia sp.]